MSEDVQLRNGKLHPSIEGVIITPYKIYDGRLVENYECAYCQYATLSQDDIRKHMWQAEHPWPFKGGLHPLLIEAGFVAQVDPQQQGVQPPEEVLNEYR